MPEYLDDPSVLTKDELKGQLLAHNVELPSGNPVKDAYVRLYLEKLTAQNRRGADGTAAAFSSDEELPPPPVSSRGRCSGRKATRKTDKALPDELDVTVLSDQDLRDELLRHGVNVGPIVASTRKVYENKLLKLLDANLLLAELDLPEMQVNHNGNSESDLYSDKEEEVPEVPEPEFVAETEPAPVVERLLRSRGKTTRTRSSQHHTVERIAASDQTTKVAQNDVPKELFPNDSNTARLVATCRPPIKGAAGRPVGSIDLWKDETFLLSPKASKTTSSSSVYTESCSVNRVTSLPPSSSLNFSASSLSTSSSRCLSAAPPAAQTKAAPHNMSLWMKIFLIAILAAFLFLIYQAMETNGINPFAAT